MTKRRIEVEEESAPDRPWEGYQTDTVRTFESGASRDTDEGKPDYAGFLSPAVIRRFGEYMHQHRYLKDGTVRASDNWKKSIPRDVYIQSMFRHFVDLWEIHEQKIDLDDELAPAAEEALCALLFNVQGYLFEFLNGR